MEIVLTDVEDPSLPVTHTTILNIFLFVSSLGLSLCMLNWTVPYGTPIFVVHKSDLYFWVKYHSTIVSRGKK